MGHLEHHPWAGMEPGPSSRAGQELGPGNSPGMEPGPENSPGMDLGLSMISSTPGRRRASGTRPGSCSISPTSPSFHSRVSRWMCPSCPCPGVPAGTASHPSETFPWDLSTAWLCPQQEPCPGCLFFFFPLATSVKAQMNNEFNTYFSSPLCWAGLRVPAGNRSFSYLRSWILLQPLSAISAQICCCSIAVIWGCLPL